MASYKWEIEHQAPEELVEDVLLNFGFETTKKGHFVQVVNDWKTLTIEAEGSILECTFHWAGDGTTEVYFDYLLSCGYLLGQLSCYLAALAGEQIEPEIDEENE